ncbi:hypothetical protein Tco_0432854 [Tanacetum coccineum]
MDDPNITMEEYIRLEEEKARRHGQRFNWQTATFGKVENYEDEDDYSIDFETEFPAIVFDNTLTAIPSEPTVCPPNKNEVDFRISLDESDDEDYTVIFDENSFSYKIIYVNDLKTDSGNDKPLSRNLMVDYFDDLNYFKDFKNEFPAIVYNDGLTSKSDLEIKPLVSSERIDEFNLIDEASLSEYDEEIVSRFNDLFNIIHPDVSKSEKDNDDNDIGIIQSSEDMAPLPAADQRHPWLRYQIEEYNEGIRHSYEQRLETIWSRLVNRVHVFVSHAWRRLFGIRAPLVREFILEFLSTCRMSDTEMGLDVVDTLCFQLGGIDPDKGDLRDYWIEISSDREFLGPAPSYIFIQDPVRRLCHKMIAYSISGRGQTPEKMIDVDLFYLRSMDRLQGVVKSFTIEQSRVSTWLITCMTQLMDASGQTYQPFDSTLVGSSRLSFQRRVRPRTGDASTSAAPHTEAQPDP